MTVTVRDSAGNPLPGASFNLKRGTALNRAKAAYDASADDLTIVPLEPTGVTSILYEDGTQALLKTGSDGKATFEVSQNGSYGFAIPLTATLMRDTSKSATLDVISRDNQPDSPKRKYWAICRKRYQLCRRDLQAPITGSGSNFGELGKW